VSRVERITLSPRGYPKSWSYGAFGSDYKRTWKGRFGTAIPARFLDQMSRDDALNKLVAECDALSKRIDAFAGRRQSHRQPVEVKPRTKDNMQPSNRHPKQVKTI
jgi:hypothetical protein